VHCCGAVHEIEVVRGDIYVINPTYLFDRVFLHTWKIKTELVSHIWIVMLENLTSVVLWAKDLRTMKIKYKWV
jgi:hypothetical protein